MKANKIKANVWGEEIEYCSVCKYCDKKPVDFFENSRYCMYLQDSIKEEDEIHPECPFLKPVTKEFLENLDFIQYENQNVYEKIVINTLYQFIIEGENITFIEWTFPDLIKLRDIEFIIYNQEHFKFILKTLDLCIN